MTSYLTALALGLLIGAQHAFEPDHLAALGTTLSDEASTPRAAARGAWWGLGHGVSIALVGLPLIAIGASVPEHLEALAEVVVAGMLVGLGVHALWRAGRAELPEAGEEKSTRGTLPVGLVHGLAGSGAAVVLATAQATSQAAALVFLVVFVFGSTLGMTTIAAALSMPLGKVAQSPARRRWLVALSGVLSVGVGCVWGGPHVMGWMA